MLLPFFSIDYYLLSVSEVIQEIFKESSVKKSLKSVRVRTTGRHYRQMGKKNIFGTKKHLLAKTSGEKNFSSKNNRHQRMPLNHQLTSWITCLKSVADQ